MALPSTRQEFKEYASSWRPRTYYIMKNKTTGKLYLGQTTANIQSYLGSGSYWKNHCKAHGGYCKENIEVVFNKYFENEDEAKLFLSEFEKQNPHYWLQENKVWANQCKENTDDNPFYDGGISSKVNKRKIEDGSHPFLKKNRSPAMNSTQFGGEAYRENMINLYGVDNPMKNKKIAKRSAESQSKTKSKKEWKEAVDPLRVKKMNKSLSQVCENGKTKREIRNEKIGEINRKHNREKVKRNEHHYQNGFYGVLEDGSTEWVSSKEYHNRKKNGCEKYAHPTSFEGKRRRGLNNVSAV